jgi:hypothetical protein
MFIDPGELQNSKRKLLVGSIVNDFHGKFNTGTFDVCASIAKRSILFDIEKICPFRN